MSRGRGGCAALGCVVVGVLVGLAAISGMWAGLTELEPPAEEPWASGDDEAEQAADAEEVLPPPDQAPEPPNDAGVSAWKEPEEKPAADDPGLLSLTYRFTDHGGRSRRMRCTVRRQDFEREVAWFGVVKRRLWERVNAELQQALEAEARERGVAGLFTIQVERQGAYRWRYRTPGDRSLRARAEAFHAWLDNDAHRVSEEIVARAYGEHGFRLERSTVSVDYGRIVDQATHPLADCYLALHRSGEDVAADRLAGLFLAFFQELRYEIPPDVDALGRETLGFRVPTEVLVRKAGDCDSKAAAFCAVWRQLPARSLIVLVPDHALVAVEGRPGPDQAHVRIGNRYYILCEVAGPGKAPPGATSISGSFEYVLIEPAG